MHILKQVLIYFSGLGERCNTVLIWSSLMDNGTPPDFACVSVWIAKDLIYISWWIYHLICILTAFCKVLSNYSDHINVVEIKGETFASKMKWSRNIKQQQRKYSSKAEVYILLQHSGWINPLSYILSWQCKGFWSWLVSQCYMSCAIVFDHCL